MKNLIALLFCSTICSLNLKAQVVPAMHNSHDATVRIISKAGNSSGSSFLIADQVVLTCFHVVSSVRQESNGLYRAQTFNDLQIILSTGEELQADLVSLPSDTDPAPFNYDFAFLKLRTKPSRPIHILRLADDKQLDSIDIGEDMIFSGYPLAAPGMLTQKGMISGFSADKSILAIEGPVNKGNSGGALIDQHGNVVGIVSLREGGITQGLSEVREQINGTERSGMTMTMGGVNPLAATKMLIDTIDQYISVGIGYAKNIKFARDYLVKHPAIVKM